MKHILIGSISSLLYGINTLFWVPLVLILAVFKLIIPLSGWRKFVSYFLDECATSWITFNNINQRITARPQINVTGLDALTKKEWYLVIANHQSWVDILILQRVFNRRIPFLKFFLKKELIWVPLLGLAWWALDFPFMQRHSKSFLAKNPHLKGKDMETTRKACEKFKTKPVSVMNFVEGTRFTPAKHQRQRSPYTHLLKPKAGGIAFVLSAMGGQLHKLIDVTIHYPEGIPTFWDFVSGKTKHVDVHISVTEIKSIVDSGYFADDYFDNPEQRSKFQQWLNSQWLNKDKQLDEYK